MTSRGPAYVFCWENFGPTHVDRCEAVALRFPEVDVVGLEYRATSAVYDWTPASGVYFRKLTRRNGRGASDRFLTGWIVWQVLRRRAKHVFLCHYNEIGVQVAAILLRLLGRRVYLLIDSKFDDFPRLLWRECLKSLWLKPYAGAIAGSLRTRQFLGFLGLDPCRVKGSYDAVSLERIRRLAASPPAPAGVPFAERHLTIVARLVPKKNLFVAIEAFARYAKAAVRPRALRIFGNGALEQQLRGHALALGVGDLVVFEGFCQTADICLALATSVALLLVSVEEQFGLAVIEALAMGVPVLVSSHCGVRDDFVRTGVNGFLVEPDNVEGLAYLIGRLCGDERLWSDLARGAAALAEQADAGRFAESVAQLVGLS